MKNRHLVILLLVCAYLLSVPLYAISEDRTYQEELFKVTLPSTWTRMPQQMLEEMKNTMVSGGRELARASKSADPNDISHEAIPFVSGFQLKDGSQRILLTFSGVSSPIIMNRDDMYKTNQERVKWGIDTGRLKTTSNGVSKLDIDGIPCLLQDIETKEGGRLQMYSFFIPEYPRMVYSVQIICDDMSTYNKHANDLASIIKSIKIVRKSQK
jgi:hypothetical protein